MSRRLTAPVPEAVVRLVANGRTVAVWTATPAALDALAVGRLHAMGYVHQRSDVLDIDQTTAEGRHEVHVRIASEAEEAGRSEARHRREHGCGPRFLLDCRPDLLSRRPRPATPAPGTFPDLFRELFERSPSRETTGGHHTAALGADAGLVHLFEEVGRHNAADKAIGAALLAGEDPGRMGLVTSARISAEIAEKAARAGLAWVASRSVPTTLATEIAAAAALPIVARAASRDVRIFTGEDG